MTERCFVLREHTDGSWEINQSDSGGVWPATFKRDARGMIARLMQLLDVGPLAAQTTPERVGIDP